MQYLTTLVDWLEAHAALSTTIVVGSIVFGLGSLWAVHRFLITIPADYFQHDHKPFERWSHSRPVLRWCVIIGKNVLGAFLILIGIVMLFAPGQGVLSVLLGVSLIDVPGKRAFERRILKQEKVLELVNRLRARADRPPLEL